MVFDDRRETNTRMGRRERGRGREAPSPDDGARRDKSALKENGQ